MNITQLDHDPGVPSDADPLQPGRLLGQYQLVRPLGAGGMGAVFEAVHTGLGKAVAIKTLTPALLQDPESETRFLREAEAASRLQHPHVVDVTDFGSDGGVIYLVMELLRGEDLGSLLARAPAGLDLEFVADTLLAVCAGVFAAHEMGVFHRDLKPQNIFLQRTPLGAVVPKVLDFGISKLVDGPDRSTLTHPGVLMGTTHYISPEQVMGGEGDRRSDQFALGVILYECLTGRHPHEGETCFGVMRSICEGRFPALRQLRPDLPPAFEAVVLRAMHVRPQRRFDSVHALGRALLPFASARGQVLWTDYFSSAPCADGGGSYSGGYSGPHSGGHSASPSGGYSGSFSSSAARTSRLRRPAMGFWRGRRFFGALALTALVGAALSFLPPRQAPEPPLFPEPPARIAQHTPDPVPMVLPPIVDEAPPVERAAAPVTRHAPRPGEVRKPAPRKPAPRLPPPVPGHGRTYIQIAPILD